MKLEDISAISNFKIINGTGAPSNYPLNASKATPRIAVQKQSGINAAQSDYFVNSNQNLSGTSNPFISTIDDCLVRVAPKIYLGKYMTEGTLQKAVQENPKITEILSTKGLTPEIHIENVTGKNQEHFLTTYEKAKQLGSDLSSEDYSSLMQAALLHDIGKAFIPPEILNKPGKLTDSEREIVDLHASLGAEVLKTTNLSSKVIEAVGLHHTDYQNPRKQGSEISQILSVTDVYSALKEERPYKKKFSNEQVRDIIQGDSKLNPDMVNEIFYSEDLSNMKNFAS